MSQGNPAKTTLTPGLPVLPHRVPRLRLRLRRGDLVRPVPDHRRADAAPALAHARARRAPRRWRLPARAQAVTTAHRASRRPARLAALSSATPSWSSSRWSSSTRSSSSSANSFKTEPDAAAQPAVADPATRSPRPASRGSSTAPTSRCWLGNSVLVTVLVTVGRVLPRLAGRLRPGPAALPRPAARSSPTIIAVMAVPGVVLLIPKFLVLNQLGHLRQLHRADPAAASSTPPACSS